MKSKESLRDLGDLKVRRRLHHKMSQSSAPARHRPPIAPIETPTAWPDVRLVDGPEPLSAGTGGDPVAEALVDVEAFVVLVGVASEEVVVTGTELADVD